MKKLLLFIFICLQLTCYGSEISQNNKYKILVGSPVCQKPAILKEFLESLKRLDTQSFTLDYFFVDDNNIEESKQLLQEFNNDIESKSFILSSKNDLQYDPDETTHLWSPALMWKVASFKDLMIQKAINENYDYLFLIDSDIVLHPETINQLIDAKKDIISNIYWTKWNPNSAPLPQVWLTDNYHFYKQDPLEVLTREKIIKRANDFIYMLKKPGIYEVGGLGACTLISKEALQKGVSFQKISNLLLNGEDRHFCVRAVILGLSLFVDTHYPAFHIYRESELAGVEEFKRNCETLNSLCNSSSTSLYDSLDLESRFFLTSDEKTNSVADFALPTHWWSRPFEYKWAAKFTGSEYVVLDAACGISHPFKWLLSDTCSKAWACDMDPRILDYEKIMQETQSDLSKEANKILNDNIHRLLKVQLVCSSICNLPEYMPKFDRIFCISTLEHMSTNDIKKALAEFAKKLAPNGLVIITVDYPVIKPQDLLEIAKSVGLIPAGNVEVGAPPKDAVNGTPYYPSLYVYRCVLKHGQSPLPVKGLEP